MKNFGSFLFLFSVLFFACEDAPKAPERKEDAAPVSKKMEPKVLVPSEIGGVDFWVDNGCTRKIPVATVSSSNRPEGYTFNLNKQQGYAKEVMVLDNGYKLDITSKGCNSIWVTHSYFFPSTDLDMNDAKAVSRRVLELIEKTTEFSTPPIDIKSKLQPLKMAVEQLGPFNIGEEFILSDGEVKETFAIDKLDTNGEKIFLQYYFTKGPV